MERLTSKARVGSPTMRPLMIDADAKALIARVRDYAEHPESIYRPLATPEPGPPGDNPKHVAQLNTFRVVYSVTDTTVNRYRHLSISVPGKDYPNPFAAMEIARLFGFTGWDGKRALHCNRLLQFYAISCNSIRQSARKSPFGRLGWLRFARHGMARP